MKVFLLSLLCAILVWPISGFAELYKWKDEQGNLHITDIPPPENQKKSVPMSAKPSRSTPPQKMTGGSDVAGESRALVPPVLNSMSLSSPTKGGPAQLATEGLSPRRATLVSPWQLFDGPQTNAKAPVHRWKDEQGLDHFTDVLPVGKSASPLTTKSPSLSAKPKESVRQAKR